MDNMGAYEVSNRFLEKALSCLQEFPFPNHPNDKVIVILEANFDFCNCFTREEAALINDAIKTYEKSSGKSRFEIAHDNKVNNIKPMLRAGFLTSAPQHTF